MADDVVLTDDDGSEVYRLSKTWRAITLRNHPVTLDKKPRTSYDTVWIHACDCNGNSGITLRTQAGNDTIRIDGESGDIILLNADCAEEFEVSGSELVEPGTVMTFNDVGQLSQCSEPYDKRVAGVIAGAGDLRPGLILGSKMGSANRVPISLIGKVLCKVDASYASIEVGDLLTTSATIGHAMKAKDPEKSFGAVLGKALQPLKRDCNLIPILVALQ